MEIENHIHSMFHVTVLNPHFLVLVVPYFSNTPNMNLKNHILFHVSVLSPHFIVPVPYIPHSAFFNTPPPSSVARCAGRGGPGVGEDVHLGEPQR